MTNRRRPPPPNANSVRNHRGLSLVELLVAMVIGLVVIGVVFANYLTSGIGRNSNTALSQISEDATTALNFIRKQITQAGYSRPYKLNSANGMDRIYSGNAIFGCDGAFTNPKAPFISELTCDDKDTTSSSIAIVYEADERNSVLRKVNQPGDCVGDAITASSTTDVPPLSYFLAESRLYVDDKYALSCQGNGQSILPTTGTNLTSTPQPLISNVFSMRIRYGLARSRTAADGPLPLTPVKFVTAKDVGVATSAAWNDVTAVRVCIVVRSEDEVMPDKTPYYGCDAVEDTTPKLTTPTDRRMYRAFSTTVMVQNRLGG